MRHRCDFTTKELIQYTAEYTGFHFDVVNEIVRTYLKCISDLIKKGEGVRIRNLGDIFFTGKRYFKPKFKMGERFRRVLYELRKRGILLEDLLKKNLEDSE